MKRFFAIVVLLLVVLPGVRADGPDDQYIQIYNLIQAGDSLSASQPAQAQAKYAEAQTALRRFQKVYPGWNDRVVNFRLSYLASKITIVSAGATVGSNAPAKMPTPVVESTQVKTSAPPVLATPEPVQTVTLPVAPMPTNARSDCPADACR